MNNINQISDTIINAIMFFIRWLVLFVGIGYMITGPMFVGLMFIIIFQLWVIIRRFDK